MDSKRGCDKNKFILISTSVLVIIVFAVILVMTIERNGNEEVTKYNDKFYDQWRLVEFIRMWLGSQGHQW